MSRNGDQNVLSRRATLGAVGGAMSAAFLATPTTSKAEEVKQPRGVALKSTGTVGRNKLDGSGRRFTVRIQTGSDRPAVVSVQDNNLSGGPNPITIYVHARDNVFPGLPPLGEDSRGVILDILFDKNVGNGGGISFFIAQEGMSDLRPLNPRA